MYQLIKDPKTNQSISIRRLADDACIPTVAANTDYANFKKQILADKAQLQDADGNVMADAKAYVASLP